MNNKERTKEQHKDESMAIFIAGQILGLASLMNVKALEEFLASDRPRKGDFKYTNECRELVKFHNALFTYSPSSKAHSASKRASRRSNNNP